MKNKTIEQFPAIFPRFAPEKIAGKILFSRPFACLADTSYQVDITNVFYELAIPDIWITLRFAVTCVGGSNVQFTVTGTNIPQGVRWTMIPTNFVGHAEFQITTNYYASVTPGNVATNYKVRATSKDNANFHDEVSLQVLKVDIVETNVYAVLNNTVALHLKPDSTPETQWEIRPALQNGAFIQGSSVGASIVINSGSIPANYTVRAYAVNYANCYDTCTVTAIKISLTNMTFSGGWNITRDTGETYPRPHWSATNASPYLYARGRLINVEAAFKVEPANFADNITIYGRGPVDFEFTNVTVFASGGLATYPAHNSLGVLTNHVDFWNPMAINWFVNVGASSNCYAGSSFNMIYVCLTDPSVVPKLYHTLVHLACAVGRATNAAEAVSNTWSQLSGHNFTNWAGRAFYYYKDGAGWDSPGYISQLLDTGNGNCVAWRNLFRHALKVNGVNSDYIYVQVPGRTNWFIVGDWTFGTTSFTNSLPYNWKLQFATNDLDMVPRPSGDVYGDLTSLTNIPGQNTAPPSEKIFINHRLARYNGVYYDPSYGVTHASINSFVDAAVDGYAYYHDGDPTTNFVIRVKSASGVYKIEELVNDSTNDFTNGLP